LINGWQLHTYQAVHIGLGREVNHYLLLEKILEDQPPKQLSQKERIAREEKLAKIKEQFDRDIKKRNEE